jgi:hypothetical protein
LETKDKGSRSFQGQDGLFRRFWVILEFLEWFEGLGAKDRGSCEVLGFFGDFGGFLDCLERFRTYS